MEEHCQSTQVKNLQPNQDACATVAVNSVITHHHQHQIHHISKQQSVEDVEFKSIEDVDMRSLDHSVNSTSISPKLAESQISEDVSNSSSYFSASYSETKDVSTSSFQTSDAPASPSQPTPLPTSDDKDAITSDQLADCLQKNSSSSSYSVLIDTRSFIEYNSCHIQEAVNVCCSKIIKRRLQNNKTTVRELLNNVNNGTDLDNASLIVVYDQGSLNVSTLADDSCLKVLWSKLITTFSNVRFLKGGFSAFHQSYNALCTNKAQMLQSNQKKSSIDAISQPCLPNIGPTRILPFLYLGSQVDAMNQELLKSHDITYELNVSTTCPKPDFIQDSHFLRIPVNDNYSDKLLPYFPQAINFLDKVKESSGCVLVHCLGGISRSATVAIAYIMQHMKMTSDDAYRYLKGKRATISPNFNFLGQLLEYEKQLIVSSILPAKSGPSESSLFKIQKERQENGETDFYLQPLTPSICDLNNKNFSSSSPKHHVLHQHFNPHLMCPNNQEKNQSQSHSNEESDHQAADETTDESTTSHNLSSSSSMNSSSSSIVINNSASQFTNLNTNGSQKRRACSFSSTSPNSTRNKMTLKLQSVSENDNLGSIVFM